jgi:hypothetical protein
MKHLLTGIACFLALSVSVQTLYNPDVDGDDCITVTDVLSILGLFNTCEEGYTFYYLKAMRERGEVEFIKPGRSYRYNICL